MIAVRFGCFVVAVALGIGDGSVTLRQGALASVSGIVLTAEGSPKPVRRAIVSLREHDCALGYHAITDDSGRFEIKDLPPGRYDLSAKRLAFVTIAFGASRPEWPGTQLVLEAGQRLSDLTLRLAPGAVIAGTVRDANGEPAPDLEVHLARRTPAGGLFEQYARTDPKGAYRLYGLAAGHYIVSVRPLRSAAATNYSGNDAEVDAIFQRLLQGQSGMALVRSGQTSVPREAVPDFAPIFYPNVAASEDAMPVVVGVGEERGGVDMTIRLTPMVRLTGRVAGNDGRPVGSGTVELIRGSRHASRSSGVSLRGDGTFEFPSVSPGRYQLVIWRASAIAAPTAPCEFAAANVEVRSGEPPEVMLVLRPCLRIAGSIEIASDAAVGAKAASLAGLRLRLEPDRSRSEPIDSALPIVATVGGDGMLTFGGSHQLVPGAFTVRAENAGNAPGTGWWLQSARTADGRDVLDAPLILTDTTPETTHVVFTFTDRHTSLSGRLATPGGRAAVDYTVIAFTTNRDWWRPPFRRVLTARPATDGSFLLHDLPPGEYFLGAMAEVAPNEWLDPLVLDEVAKQSVLVTIRPGARTTQSIQIKGGSGYR
jgi:hypothetical protein